MGVGVCSLRLTSQASSLGTCWRLMNSSFQLMINFYMKWKTKQSFLILVILYWPFNTLPQAHTHINTHISRFYDMKLTHVALDNSNTPTENDRRQEYRCSYLTVCFWELFTCLADPPGSSISQHPWLPPEKAETTGDWDRGFDLHTTPLNHREEAGIFSKGCLCAPVPQEDWAKSSMKVSEL